MKIEDEVENQYLNDVLYNTSLKDLWEEKWKVIKGMDNYAISNYGRIKSLERWTELPSGYLRKEYELIRKLSFRRYFNKYLNRHFYVVQCGFSINGIPYIKSVARLVYYHFVEEFDLDNHSVVISYKDNDSLHLYYKNLELLSRREKSVKVIQQNRAKNRIVEYKRSVCQYTVEGKLINTFDNIYVADKMLNIGCRNILYVIQGRVFTAGGFRWFWSDYIPKKKDFLANKAQSSNDVLNTALWKKLGQPLIDKGNPPACMNLSPEDLPNECWKPIPSFENQYLISDKGRIKRLSGWTSDNNIFFPEEKIMPLNLMGKAGNKNRYLYIRLNRRKKRTLLIINRLLYYSFVERFDINDKTIVIDNKNEMIWDIDVSKLSLCSISSLLNQKRINQRNHSKE